MADFLSYGTTKGLSKRLDWGGMIDQRLKNEQMLLQSKEISAQRAKEYAEKMNPYETEIGWLTEDLNKHNDSIRSEIATFLKDKGDSWRYTVEGQMEFNKLTKKFLDNDLVKIDKTAKQNWEMLQKNISNMSPDHIRREQQKYQAFIENENGDRQPYIYDPSPTYNINQIFDEAAESAGITTDEHGYRIVTEVTPENLDVIANSYMAQNEYEIRDAWSNFTAKNKYGNNVYEWVKANIRARTDRQSVTDYKGMAARAGSAGSSGYNFYKNEASVEAQTLETGMGLSNAWAVFTNSSYEDGQLTPDKAVLNNPNEIWALVDGKLTEIGSTFGFDKVGIASVGEVYIDENAGSGDPYKEFVKVEVIAEKNHGAATDYFQEAKGDDKKRKYNELVRLSDVNKEGLTIVNTSMFSSSSGASEQLEAYRKNQSAKTANKPREYRAYVYVPIDRNSATKAMKYNQIRGGDANAIKAAGEGSESSLTVPWEW